MFAIGMPGDDITLLLQQWRMGNDEAEARLFELVLPELHLLASRLLQRERRDHTLQPTELVNQTYLRLAGSENLKWQNRRHFFAICARIMRRLLIDYARNRPAAIFVDCEGLGGRHISEQDKLDQAVQLDALLDQLEKDEPTWCSVVELKFFLGLTDEEASEVLEQPVRTIQRQWHDARRWLYERLSPAKDRH